MPESSVSLSPQCLYFLAPRLALGGTVNLGYARTASSYSAVYGIGPAIQYYLAGPTAKTLPFVGASWTPVFDREHVDATSFAPAFDGRALNSRYEATAGVTQLLVDHVGLSATGYLARVTDSYGASQPGAGWTVFGIRFGITAFLY